MKKMFLISLAIFIFSSISCFAKNYSTQEDLKKIEQETQKCIDANFASDYTMAQCVIKGTEKYNFEIEKTVKAAKNYLSGAQYEQFLKRQEKWIKSAKKYNDKVQNTTYPPYQPYLMAADDEYEYVKARAMDLSGFLGTLLLFKKDGP